MYVIGKYMIVKDVRIKYKSNDELNLLESDDLCQVMRWHKHLLEVLPKELENEQKKEHMTLKQTHKMNMTDNLQKLKKNINQRHKENNVHRS